MSASGPGSARGCCASGWDAGKSAGAAGCGMGTEDADVIGGGSGCGCIVGKGAAFGFNAKFVVVSAFVPVTGGSVSPGPWIVDATPEAEPSSTVS